MFEPQGRSEQINDCYITNNSPRGDVQILIVEPPSVFAPSYKYYYMGKCWHCRDGRSLDFDGFTRSEFMDVSLTGA
jgi:hypothetical protein